MLYLTKFYLMEGIFFFCFGSLICRLAGEKDFSFSKILIWGVSGFFACFEAFALPLTLLQKPLHWLSASWILFTGAVCLLAAALCFRQWLGLAKRILCGLRDEWGAALVFLFCLLVQMALIYMYKYIGADASYYVGKVTTDVYTDSLGLYNPYTGAALKSLNVRYLFACYPDYNAVISQVFGIHPILQAQLVMPMLLILVIQLLYYRIGLTLFDGDRRKAVWLPVFVFLISYFSNTIYTSSAFLFTRLYEGKAILGNLVIPAILYGYLCQYKNAGNPRLIRILYLIVGISSVTFTSSSMMIVPVLFFFGFVLFALLRKKWAETGWYLLYVLPNAGTAAVYLLWKLSVISFAVGA